MNLRPTVAAWIGALVVVTGAVLFDRRVLERERHFDPQIAVDHLDDQWFDEARLELHFFAAPFGVRGVLRGILSQAPSAGAPASFSEVRAVVAEGCEIESLLVDGVEAQPCDRLLDRVIAAPRALRRFELPDATSGAKAKIELHFRATPMAPTGDVVPWCIDPIDLVRVGPLQEEFNVALSVDLPEGVELLTTANAPREVIQKGSGEVIQKGTGHVELGAWPARFPPLVPPLVVGQLEWSEPFGPARGFHLIAARGGLPEKNCLQNAATLVATVMDEGTPFDVVAILDPRLLPGESQALGGNWVAVAPPRGGSDLACSVLAARLAVERRRHPAIALATPPSLEPLRRELIDALPAALVRLQLEPTTERPEVDALTPPLEFTLDASAAAGLRAWTTLATIFGDRARAAARQCFDRLTGAVGEAESPFLAEPTVQATIDWALAGSHLRFEDLAVTARGGRQEITGELVLDPPPPALADPLFVGLLLVCRDRSQFERVALTGARTRVEGIVMREAPLVVALDPQGRLPLLDRGNLLLPLDLSPRTFAVAADASALAVALDGSVPREMHGVLILEGGGDAAVLKETPWLDLPAAVDELHWVVPRRFLAVAGASSSRATGSAADDFVRPGAILDLVDGGMRELDGTPLFSPRGGIVVTEAERAPGCFSHHVLDLKAGLERPLALARRGRVDWVRGAGADELVTEDTDGRALIVDLDGVTRVKLAWPATAVRDVRRTSFGYSLVTEAVDGSRLELVSAAGEPLETVLVAGRLRGSFFSPDTGFFFLLSQIGPRDHQVARVRFGNALHPTTLYRGPDRPLPDLSLQKGAVLVDAASDGAPAGAPRRLLYRPFDADGGEAVVARLICAEAFLEPAPVLASAGRYLYYLRAAGGPRGLPGSCRPRTLNRYDLLTGREVQITLR